MRILHTSQAEANKSYKVHADETRLLKKIKEKFIYVLNML